MVRNNQLAQFQQQNPYSYIARVGARAVQAYGPRVAKYVGKRALEWYNQPKPKRLKIATGPKTMGSYYTGQQAYGGRFRKPKRKFPQTVQGISHKVETGGETVASDLTVNVLLGSTPITPSSSVHYAWMAVLKLLAKKAGIDFISQYEQIDQSRGIDAGVYTATLAYEYSVENEPDVTVIGVNALVNENWQDFAIKIATSVQVQYVNTSGSTDARSLTFKKVALELYTKETTNVRVPGSCIIMDDCSIEMTFKEHLKIQNRTGANTGTETSTDLTEANPLVGRMYIMRKPKVTMRESPDDTVTPSWDPSDTTGMLFIDPSEASYNAQLKNYLNNLPAASLFSNLKSTANLRLAPGQIKHSSVGITKKGKFNWLYNEMYAPFHQGSESRGGHGPLQLFAFKKQIRTGTGTAQVTLGYEKTIYMSFTVRENRKRAFIPTTARL